MGGDGRMEGAWELRPSRFLVAQGVGVQALFPFAGMIAVPLGLRYITGPGWNLPPPWLFAMMAAAALVLWAARVAWVLRSMVRRIRVSEEGLEVDTRSGTRAILLADIAEVREGRCEAWGEEWDIRRRGGGGFLLDAAGLDAGDRRILRDHLLRFTDGRAVKPRWYERLFAPWGRD